MTHFSWAGGGRSLTFVVFHLLATLAVGHAAEQRSWTNQQGRTIQATLLHLDGEMVVLRFQGKEVSVPLDSLSAADQQYVAAQQAVEDAPEREKAAQLAARRELRRVRKWTDRYGKSTFSSFVRIHQGKLVLKRGSQEQTRSFDEFSEEDQAFVKEHLERGGETDMLADLESDRMAKLAAEEARRSKFEAATNRILSRSPNADFPSIPPPPAMPRMPTAPEPPALPSSSSIAHSERINEILAEQRRQREQSLQELRDLKDRMAQQRREATERFHERTRQQQQATRDILESSRPQIVVEPETTLVCMSCDREVPAHTKPGDYCPHCRVRFAYEVDDQGNRTYANGNVVKPVGWKARVALFLSAAFFAVVGVGGGIVLWIVYH